jgi:hypothetical protein
MAVERTHDRDARVRTGHLFRSSVWIRESDEERWKHRAGEKHRGNDSKATVVHHLFPLSPSHRRENGTSISATDPPKSAIAVIALAKRFGAAR